MMMRRSLIGCALLVSCAAPAWASETGSQPYPIGVNTVANGNLPPPGMMTVGNYSLAAWNNSLAGNDGGNAVRKFSLPVQADAVRILYTWENIHIGPFHYTTGLVPTLAHTKLSINGLRGSQTQFANLDIQNYLGYASPDHKVFFYFGLDTYVPTGPYDKDKLVNIGLNYWGFSPNFDITYNPSPKWELTGTVIASFYTTNHATHYHSGSDIDFDYGVTYRPFEQLPKLGLGFQGYFYKQIEDDTVRGASVDPDGNRGQEFAIGPQVRWDLPFGGIAMKFQHEFAVRNRPHGNRLWFQFALPIFGKPRGG